MDNILKRQIDLKQVSSDTYSISWDNDWTMGMTLHGGCIAAALHHALTTHLVTVLSSNNQPDVLSLHIEFLRPCEPRESAITITPLKIGVAASTFQLQLTQGGKMKIMATATSTNFDISLGPTAATDWSFHPAPLPKPDFNRVLAHQPDEHWVPGLSRGELLPLTGRKLGLFPRAGFTVDGVCDAWNCFLGDERMDATYLALMADMFPSISDTLLRNGGPYDAHAFHQKMKMWAEENPGIPCIMPNSVAEAMQATIFHFTLTMDIEYKKRLPTEGVHWTFTRAASKMMQGGRLDIEISLCDENLELLATARQLVLVLDAQKKFRGIKKQSVL